MLQAPQPSFHAAPTAEDYLAASRRRTTRLAVGGALLALAAAGSYVGVSMGNPLLPLVVFILVLTPILLWRYPAFALYTVFTAVCLCEVLPMSAKDSFTDKFMFFWNVNSIVQTVSHSQFKAMPVNLMELFLLSAGAISLVKAIYSRSAKLETGALFWPIFIYILFVVIGWVHGVATGGDFKISLQEVRSQFYFLAAYLMALNVIRTPDTVAKFQWIMVIGIGFKGILYTFRRYVTMAGMPLPDQGVGSHEEAFLFDAFGAFLMVLVATGVQKKMQAVMWALLPFVLLGNLACNRRAATAAMVVLVPLLLVSAYRALPERRRLAGIASAVLAIGGFGYYQAFKNSDSAIAQPARAIRSQFSPDERDALSNAYRDAENADILATVKLEPALGYGYGKKMLHAYPIADISKTYEWWDILPHNNVLWVWMRVGTLGFIAFWAMVSGIIFQACALMKKPGVDNSTKAIGMYSLLVIGMLMIFGLLDLQLSNFRDMLFTGFWAGVVASASTMTSSPAAKPPEGRTR